MAKPVAKYLNVKVEKVDADLGLVFGFGIVCKEDGEDYWDTDDEHTGQQEMLVATSAYMQGDRIAKDGHQGPAIGLVVFGFPLTEEIAKSMEIESRRYGFMIGMRPRSDILAKFVSGERTGFSMGGTVEGYEDEAA